MVSKVPQSAVEQHTLYRFFDLAAVEFDSWTILDSQVPQTANKISVYTGVDANITRHPFVV